VFCYTLDFSPPQRIPVFLLKEFFCPDPKELRPSATAQKHFISIVVLTAFSGGFFSRRLEIGSRSSCPLLVYSPGPSFPFPRGESHAPPSLFSPTNPKRAPRVRVRSHFSFHPPVSHNSPLRLPNLGQLWGLPRLPSELFESDISLIFPVLPPLESRSLPPPPRKM